MTSSTTLPDGIAVMPPGPELGAPLDTNLGPACSHDHDARTTGGWTVTQHRPGRFTWTSPTGHHYDSPAPRIVPQLPPPPLPPEHRDRSDPLPDEYADHGPLWHDDPRPVVPDPAPPPHADDDRYPDEPPF